MVAASSCLNASGLSNYRLILSTYSERRPGEAWMYAPFHTGMHSLSFLLVSSGQERYRLKGNKISTLIYLPYREKEWFHSKLIKERFVQLSPP